MPRKREYVTVKLERIYNTIAQLELTGRETEAQGLRNFFIVHIDETAIERCKKDIAIANDIPFKPQYVIPPPTRKTGIFLEKKTLNRNGKHYEYNYWNVYNDGRRKKTFKNRDDAEKYAEEIGISKYF